MSEEQAAPEVTDLGAIPSTVIQPEEAGTLSVRYVDGQPVLVVTGGSGVPAGLTVVDGSGDVVAQYTAGPVPAAEGLVIRARGSLLPADQDAIKQKETVQLTGR